MYFACWLSAGHAAAATVTTKNVTTHAEDLQIATAEKNKQTRRKQKRAKEKAQSETGHTVENYPWVKMQ